MLTDNYKQIEGWFDFEDVYQQIYDAVPDKGTIIEIGCFLGKSTRYMAELIMNGKKEVTFYTIDTFLGSREHKVESADIQFEKFMANMRIAPSVDKCVFPIRLRSDQAAGLFLAKSVDAVFIDGDHSHDGVISDLADWYPRLKMDGEFWGHDAQWGEVRLAVSSFCKIFGLDFEVENSCWHILL